MASGLWVGHVSFTNLSLTLPILRDRSSWTYLFSLDRVWQWRHFQGKVSIGTACLKVRDASPTFSLLWNQMNQAIAIHLQNRKCENGEVGSRCYSFLPRLGTVCMDGRECVWTGLDENARVNRAMGSKLQLMPCFCSFMVFLWMERYGRW